MPVCLTLPTPAALQALYPLADPLKLFIANTRREIANILAGHDPRFLVVVGPCSIHDTIAARDYAMKLRELAARTPSLYLVMRTYFEKSRTADGWKGLLYDPHLDSSHAIPQGLANTRRLLLELTQLHVPTAAELLEPCAAPYFDDLLSWACIGARTATSQIHRQLASGLPMPVAFKNSLDGNIDHAILGAAVAALPQHYLGIDLQGHISMIATEGNPHTHIVLRGSDSGSNYDTATINTTLSKLSAHCLPQSLLIDCSHGNSQRQPQRQADVLHALIDHVINDQPGIRGIILESHLHGGSQQLQMNSQPLLYGVSITDPCLGWEETEELLLATHRHLQQRVHHGALLALARYQKPLISLPVASN